MGSWVIVCFGLPGMGHQSIPSAGPQVGAGWAGPERVRPGSSVTGGGRASDAVAVRAYSDARSRAALFSHLPVMGAVYGVPGS